MHRSFPPTRPSSRRGRPFSTRALCLLGASASLGVVVVGLVAGCGSSPPAAESTGGAPGGGLGGARGTGGITTGAGGAATDDAGAGGAAGSAVRPDAGGPGGGRGAGGAAGATGGLGGATGAPVIINDQFWRDTAGTPIYSQGGGVLQVGDTFYWYGVKYGGAVTYAANPTRDNSDTSFAGVTIYSSKNLVDWKLESTVMPGNTAGWFGRLGVVYHAATTKYVLVAQGGGGLYFATSDTPIGPFTFNNVQMNLPGIVNGATGDQTTFQDDDGKAYLISSSSMGRAHRYVSPLRAADYLAAGNAVLVYSGVGREGNCMFKHAGVYYFCSSDLHGWNASPSYCVSATNINGPYSAEFVMGGTNSDFSHVTQTGFFVSVKGTAQNTIIFAGDRWSDFAGNGLGFNQWMPLSFAGTMPSMQSLTHWSIDTTTGAWSVDPRNNYVLNPSFEADRVVMTQPAGWTTTNGTNVQTPHAGRWSWQLTGTSSLSQHVAGLPSGTYALSLWVEASATGAQVRASGFGGADVTAAIPQATGWTRVTIPGISVSNGQCSVTVTTAGQTVSVDDFVLSRG